MPLFAKFYGLIFLLSIGYLPAQNCDFLNKIAERCINVRYPSVYFQKLPNCAASLKSIDSIAAKKEFVSIVLSDQSFIEQVALLLRFRILKGTTHTDVYSQIESFDVLSLMLPLAMDDAEEWQMYQDEIKRLYKIYLLEDELYNGVITIEDTYKILFDNFFYDNQNMGDDNFINSTFQYTTGRNPTYSELVNARNMINNRAASLFYKKGNSKIDYLKIITSNQNFYEYQVKYWYNYFLFENPTDQKVFDIIKSIKRNQGIVSIESIIRQILIYNL
jgi:hypothetical protein